MSSLVSLRTRERRKSAGARLQSASQCDSLSQAPRKSSDKKESADRQKRAESGIPELHVRVPRRRVKSALETRKEQETSDIFNQQQKALAPADPSWGLTQYSEDFGPKRVTPVPVRPASSTRRNNPHPSHAFMVWQYPTRIHKHHRSVPPPPDTWRYINEGFYEDYTNDYNTGDAKNEVPVTNLAKIEFPGSPKKKTLGDISGAHLLSGVSGLKAHLTPRTKDPSTESRRKFRPPSPQTQVIRGTVKETSLPVVKEWLKVASTKERDLLLQMLRAGYNSSEVIRLNKALESIVQPESVESVQNWLQNASEAERQMILHVLETLAIATDDNKVPHSLGHYSIQNYQLNGLDNHHRSYSHPITLRPRKSSSHHQSKSHKDHYSKHHRQHSKQKNVSEASGTSGVFDGRSFGLHGKKMIIKSSRDEKSSFSELKPELWHNRILKKHTGAQITHASGVFSQPQKDMGQHYAHHWEWPIA